MARNPRRCFVSSLRLSWNCCDRRIKSNYTEQQKFKGRLRKKGDEQLNCHHYGASVLVFQWFGRALMDAAGCSMAAARSLLTSGKSRLARNLLTTRSAATRPATASHCRRTLSQSAAARDIWWRGGSDSVPASIPSTRGSSVPANYSSHLI